MRKDDTVRLRHMLDAAKEAASLKYHDTKNSIKMA